MKWDRKKFQETWGLNKQEGLGRYTLHECGIVFNTLFGKIKVDPREHYDDTVICYDLKTGVQQQQGCRDYVIEFLPEPGKYVLLFDIGNGWWSWDGQYFDKITINDKEYKEDQ